MEKLVTVKGEEVTLPKKVKLKLVGIDGNAFFIMGAFSRQARREGWTQAEITKVLDEARAKDYSHLLCVIQKHCR